MRRSWQLQTAKNHFSELVDEALRKGPQTVIRHGRDAVVVLSVEEYSKLIKPKAGLVEFLSDSPLKGVELDLERDQESSREVSL